MTEMIIVGNARYRHEDAVRLGLVTKDQKVLTVNSAREARTDAPVNPITTEALTVDTDQRPTKSATKAEWTAYAIANGKTEADLDGLKRDDIVALFPEAPAAPATDAGDGADK
jgi:hypothetical protein